MLTLIKQTDILKHWDKVEKCIDYLAKTTLRNPNDEETLRNSIRDNLIADNFKLWMLMDDNNSDRIKALVITSFNIVSLVQKSLHIYALLGFEHITSEEYLSGFNKLKAFAKESGCSLVTAESSNDFIVTKFKTLGGTGYSLNLYWEV